VEAENVHVAVALLSPLLLPHDEDTVVEMEQGGTQS
jgi:hypothetical protein